jgi:hypothetical protein
MVTGRDRDADEPMGRAALPSSDPACAAQPAGAGLGPGHSDRDPGDTAGHQGPGSDSRGNPLMKGFKFAVTRLKKKL